jgi:SAM-dependent methyltransferase
MASDRGCFDRSGLASLDDLGTSECRGLLAALEGAQAEFLLHEAQFRSADYKWPRDPLHTWSRIWEYPYVLHHLRTWRSRRTAEGPVKVMDFGSGVTFFPFALVAEGFDVTAVDIDPVAERDFNRANHAVTRGPGRAQFVTASPERVPLSDASVDGIYSVSVLEHVPDPARTLSDLARLLVPGGLLLVTIDLCIRGDAEIQPGPFDRLMGCLDERFEWAAPQRTVHPARVLDSGNGPIPYRRPASRWRRLLRLGKRTARRMLRLPSRPPLPEWACMGMVLRKR